MGATKTGFFTDGQNTPATLAKALGHPAGIAVIAYLTRVDECIGGDIVNERPLAQPTVSQPLKELKNAGTVRGNIEGNSVCYGIDEKGSELLDVFFSNIITNVKKQNCC